MMDPNRITPGVIDYAVGRLAELLKNAPEEVLQAHPQHEALLKLRDELEQIAGD
jgi:hypothetical protein